MTFYNMNDTIWIIQYFAHRNFLVVSHLITYSIYIDFIHQCHPCNIITQQNNRNAESHTSTDNWTPIAQWRFPLHSHQVGLMRNEFILVLRDCSNARPLLCANNVAVLCSCCSVLPWLLWERTPTCLFSRGRHHWRPLPCSQENQQEYETRTAILQCVSA